MSVWHGKQVERSSLCNDNHYYNRIHLGYTFDSQNVMKKEIYCNLCDIMMLLWVPLTSKTRRDDCVIFTVNWIVALSGSCRNLWIPSECVGILQNLADYCKLDSWRSLHHVPHCKYLHLQYISTTTLEMYASSESGVRL